jgi:hypothetical protein
VNSTLTSLSLGANNLTTQGVAAICDALKVTWLVVFDQYIQVNRTLTSLDISSNKVGAEATACICDLLKVMRHVVMWL